MAIPYLILTDEDSNTYNLPPNFAIVDINTNATINVLNAAYAAGGENIADGFPEPKMIAVEGSITDSTLADMETAERAFKQACLKGGQLTLYTDTVSRYLEVEFAGLSETYERTLTHVDQFKKNYSVRFSIKYPFWQDASETDDDNILAGDDTVTIANGGDYLVKPVITVDADQSVNIPIFTITNTTDGSMAFTYTDASFLSGSSVVIDCAAGTIKRDGGDTKENFDGALLRLLTGNNSIDYEGAACTLTFTFRKVYL